MLESINPSGQTAATPRTATVQPKAAPEKAVVPADAFQKTPKASAAVAAKPVFDSPPTKALRPFTDDEKAGFKGDFPNLDVDHVLVSAEETPVYNCISWTTGNTQSWDWPPNMFPGKAPRQAFVQYYADRGFTPISNDAGIKADHSKNEVVAYWENSQGPTHGSVEGPTHGDRWESKCGQEARIQHEQTPIDLQDKDPHGLVSDVYGKIFSYFEKTGEGKPALPEMSKETAERLNQKVSLRVASVPPAVKDQFNSAYSDWQTYRNSPSVRRSSDPGAYCQGEGYQKLLSMGSEAMPLLVEKMQKGDFFCQYALEKLSHKKPEMTMVGHEQVALTPKVVNCGEQEKADQLLTQWLDSNW